jgi:hypothetical protein
VLCFNLNKRVNNGTFVINNTKWTNFKDKILANNVDPHAEFNVDGDIRKVRHSKCGTAIKMAEPYRINRFLEHLPKCTGVPKSKRSGAGMPTISSMFSSAATSTSSKKKTPGVLREFPCPGLSRVNHDHIPVYLDRTGVSGGGGTNLENLCNEMYLGKEFASLPDDQQLEVRAAQRATHLWHNEHDLLRIYSTSCQKMVRFRDGNPIGTPLTSSCVDCMALLQNKNFKIALARNRPDDKNYKFLNKVYRNESTAALYGRITGLKTIMDAHAKVCDMDLIPLPNLSYPVFMVSESPCAVSFVCCWSDPRRV